MEYPVDTEKLYVLVDTDDSIVQRGDRDFGKWPNVDGSEVVFPDGKEFLTVVRTTPVIPEGQTIDTRGYVIDRVASEYRYEYTYRLHNAEELHAIALAESIQERKPMEHAYRLAANSIIEMTDTEFADTWDSDREFKSRAIKMMLKAGVYKADITGIDTGLPDA